MITPFLVAAGSNILQLYLVDFAFIQFHRAFPVELMF
jgi:hypothetical protein